MPPRQKVFPLGTLRRKNVTCTDCGEVFQVSYVEGIEFDPRRVCDGCDMLTTDDMAKARAASQGECATCGRQIVLEDGVPTHLERERDEFHRPMYVTAGF